MKKVFKVFAIVLTSATAASAQHAHEASVKFNKNNENAVVANYDKPAGVVEDALKDRLEKDGLGKMKSFKGYMAYTGILWNAVSNDKLDVYFKVEGKKDHSSVTVLVSKGYDNFITSAGDAQTIEKVKTFLDEFTLYTDNYVLALNIKSQEETIKKAEKMFNTSVDNNKHLLEEKEKLERRITESNNDQILKQKSLDEEKQKLSDLKAQLPQ